MKGNEMKALNLLRDGFQEQFGLYVLDSAKFNELLMELSSEFVEANIPIVDEDLQVEMSLLLMETIGL